MFFRASYFLSWPILLFNFFVAVATLSVVRDLRRAGWRRPDSIQDWLNQYLKYAFIHEYNETTA